MLRKVFEQQGADLDEVIADAVTYLYGEQRADGAITPDPDAPVFQYWDTVNALKAISLWDEHTGDVDRALDFLAGCEKPNGMLSPGIVEPSPPEYCAETSWEYVGCLHRLGRTEDAERKLDYLLGKQLAEGPWEEAHPYIPKAFQTVPSVTGFALSTLCELDVDPRYLDEALDFLLRAQHTDGQYGLNWFYYNTHYYLTRPVTAALANYGHHAAVARTRDFVLANQRDDGSWLTEVEGFGISSSAELHTALALETLAHAGVGADDEAVRNGVAWLIVQRRPDGGWYGGPFPFPVTESYRGIGSPQEVYATAQVLSTFRKLVDLEDSQ